MLFPLLKWMWLVYMRVRQEALGRRRERSQLQPHAAHAIFFDLFTLKGNNAKSLSLTPLENAVG